MSILITGKSGFVGSNLFEYLMKDNYKVNSFSFKSNQKIGLIDNEISAVIHLTGKAHDLKKISCPEEYYKVNVDFTKQIFDSFLNSKATVFIFLSSVKAVTDINEGTLTEDVVPNPQTHYGKSKLLAEQYIFSKQLYSNKRIYVIRPCIIHGKGNKGNLTLLYNFIKKGIPYPFGAYENKRSFLSIENLCFVIKELLIQNEIPNGIYNMCDDQPISSKEIIKLIEKATNKKNSIWNIPKPLITIIAKIGNYLPLPINTERVQKLTENFVVSNKKIKNAIGKELPISALDGLRKTIQSFEI